MISKKRYNLMLNPNIIDRIDLLAKKSMVSRSFYINSVLNTHCIEIIGEDYLYKPTFDKDVEVGKSVNYYEGDPV